MSGAAPDDELTQMKLLMEDLKLKHDIWKSTCLQFERKYRSVQDAFQKEMAFCENKLEKTEERCVQLKRETIEFQKENAKLREELHGAFNEIEDLRRELHCALSEIVDLKIHRETS